MEAKELRIGNYYIDIDDQLTELSGYELYQMTIKENTESLGVSEFEPIPLTEEWLLKFGILYGFNHCGSEYEIEYGLEGYDLRLNYDVGMSKYIGDIKYVHQLQNLYFALTNKELTLK